MKTQDDILLEQAYMKVIKENQEPLYFNYGEENNPPNVGYSNKTFNVRGKDVLIKSEKDQDDDSEWYYLSLIDPETKERVFEDIGEEKIKQLMKVKHKDPQAEAEAEDLAYQVFHRGLKYW